jgi:Co/Zn/Cd efflux system component
MAALVAKPISSANYRALTEKPDMSNAHRTASHQVLAHDHIFDKGSKAAEKGTWLVMWITLAMMAIEIVAGWRFNSMALLADGWHMSSHVIAIGLSAIAYKAARHYAQDARFAFGTWKIEVLAGFTSAVFLLGIVALMVFGSIERILSPQPIHYKEAIVVAGIGLVVNLICAFILGGAHHHDDDHHHAHDDSHHHHDLNLRSAYVHVVADAATSVLAIVALGGLIAQTGKVLLDREMDHPVVAEIREAVETGNDEGETRIVDLHVWRVGKQSYSCALSAVTNDRTLTAAKVRDQLAIHEEIVHSTIEIHHHA